MKGREIVEKVAEIVGMNPDDVKTVLLVLADVCLEADRNGIEIDFSDLMNE